MLCNIKVIRRGIGTRGWLYIFALLITILCILSGPVRAEEGKAGIQWLTYQTGIAQAQESGKLILINFTAGWCRYCKKMKSETYSDPAVIAYLNEHYTPIQVDTQKEVAIASDFRVQSVPVTMFLTSQSEGLTKIPGFIDAPTFLNILTFIATESYKEMDFKAFLESRSQKG